MTFPGENSISTTVAFEHSPVGIVSFPMNNGDSPVRHVSLQEGIRSNEKFQKIRFQSSTSETTSQGITSSSNLAALPSGWLQPGDFMVISWDLMGI